MSFLVMARPCLVVLVQIYQWLFLVPIKGGRWHIIPLPLIYHLYIAFWGVICYLPFFCGNQKQPLKFTLFSLHVRLSGCEENANDGYYDFIYIYIFFFF